VFLQILEREELKAAIKNARTEANVSSKALEIRAPAGSVYTDDQYLRCCLRTAMALFYDAWKYNIPYLADFTDALSRDLLTARLVDIFLKMSLHQHIQKFPILVKIPFMNRNNA